VVALASTGALCLGVARDGGTVCADADMASAIIVAQAASFIHPPVIIGRSTRRFGRRVCILPVYHERTWQDLRER
jgi:hypothetical protein